MLNVALRRFAYLDDALAASLELRRIGIPERDVRIFSGAAVTKFEIARPHVVREPYTRADRHTLLEVLERFGASEMECRTRLWGMHNDHALIAVRAKLSVYEMHAILERFDSEMASPVLRDLDGTGWSAISDSELAARA